MLKEHYESKWQIINCHIKKLLTLPHVNQESGTELCKLLDTAVCHISAFRVMKVPIEQWDHILVYLIGEKMDNESCKLWEYSLPDKTEPTVEDIRKFLTQRCTALEMSSSTTRSSVKSMSVRANTSIRMNNVRTAKCIVCSGQHDLYRCPIFLNQNVHQHVETVRKHELCFNCLRSEHGAKNCKSQGICKRCNKRHNILLHFDLSTKTTLGPSSTSIILADTVTI